MASDTNRAPERGSGGRCSEVESVPAAVWLYASTNLIRRAATTVMLRRRDGALQSLRFDDEPRKPLTGQELPRPPEQRPESAARDSQELNVNEGPHQLGEPAGGADAESLHDGEIAAHGGQVSLVEVLERGRLGLSPHRPRSWEPRR